MREGLDGIRLSTETMIVHNGCIWFAEATSNRIYSYDLICRKCSLEYIIDTEDSDGIRLFRTMTIYGENLYVFPFSAENAYKINLSTRIIERIGIDTPPENSYDQYSPKAKFLSSFVFENKIFAVGVTYPAILEYDVNTGNIVYHNEWLSEMAACFKNHENVLFRRAEIVKNKLYIPSGRGDAILLYDMSSGEYEVCRIGDGIDGFSSVCYDGKDFWLAPLGTGAIVRWNESDRKCVIYNDFPQDFEKVDHGINDIIFWNNMLILFPGSSNMFLSVDRDTGKIFELNSQLRNIRAVSRCICDNVLFAFSMSEDALLIFDCSIQSFEILGIEDPGHIGICSENEKFFCENRIDTIKKYIFLRNENKIDRNKDNKSNHERSNEMWKEIKEFV